jgi:outer membrane protein assembly factor BamB
MSRVPLLRGSARHGAFVPLVALALAARAPAQSSGDEWPSFRGAQARGVAEGHVLPERFDLASGEKVRWRAPVAGLAHSSPVVTRGRVFVSSAVRKSGEAALKVGLYGDPSAVASEGEHDFVVLAFDAANGASLWQHTAWSGTPKHARHPKSSFAASTPATDGEHLVVNFGTEGLYAYDLDGKPLWTLDLGDLDPGPYNMSGVQWGFASSPVIHAGKVLVQCDVLSQGFVAAFDVTTGKELWRTKRADVSTWSTPTVDVRDGRAQVICNGYRHIGGYDLASGKEFWKLVGGGDAPVPAPIVTEDMILITNAHPDVAPIYAISAMAEGELSTEHESVFWYHRTRGNYMQTPLVYRERLYLLSDAGILAALDPATGEQRYRERLGDGTTGFTASMVAGDGKLYATSEEGTVHVLRAGAAFERIATSELGETCMATPAIAGGVMYWRTRGQVVAVGTK